MAWHSEMVLIVRHLVDDIDASTYTQARLEQSILIGAQLMRTEVDFGQTYTIDVDAETLSPDPTTGSRDEAFINLVCLKTAYNILRAEAKIAGNEALSVKDASSQIDTKERYKAAQKQAEEAFDNLEQAKQEYMTGSGSPGKAIVGPIPQANISIMEGNF